ncbi:MAG: TlpA family protein disulfide reductase [Planctomycetia bacterium]|nr:TlpA family protein disulfide reductase [Planctomycetia bacterium]
MALSMSSCTALPRSPAAALCAVSLLAVACGLATTVQAQPAAKGPAPGNAPAQRGGPQVPPLPEGTPEQLLEFVEGLQRPATRPRSREEMMQYMQDVGRVSVEAAERILAGKPQGEMAVRAAKLKLESLMMLGRLGDEQSAAAMKAFAATLVKGPSPELAREAERLLLVADAQEMFSSGNLENGAAVIARTAAILEANPDDGEAAGLAMQVANAFEQVPDGEALATESLRTFAPLLAKSENPQIKEMAASFAGTLRRLSLPGNPMQISGTLLDGKPFDQAALAGKVVLVDFWATWCGPCVAEVPNMLEAYDKYHDRGFEVVGVSLDEDRDAVVQFVKDKMIPWPILHERAEGAGWQHPLATFYGITGIPQMILIGRDGNVITLNARGRALEEKLAELFKDAG